MGAVFTLTTGFDEEILCGAFMNGLKELVRAEVRIHDTVDLETRLKWQERLKRKLCVGSGRGWVQ